MQRPEVYEWYVAVPFKEELEEAARSRQTSVDKLLEQIVRDGLERLRHSENSENPQIAEGEDREEHLRAAVLKLAGAIEGDDPHRAENAGAEVRARLARKYGR